MEEQLVPRQSDERAAGDLHLFELLAGADPGQEVFEVPLFGVDPGVLPHGQGQCAKEDGVRCLPEDRHIEGVLPRSAPFEEPLGKFIEALRVPLELGSRFGDVPRRPVTDFFEGGQHFMADAVPRVGDVVVGAVDHVRKTAVFAVRLDVFALEFDERPDDAVAHGRDAGEPGKAGAAGEVKEDGLRVVRGRMGGGNAHAGQVRVLPQDAVGDLLEEPVAHLPAAGLEGLAALCRQFRHIGMESRERDAPFLTERPAELLVPVGFRAADAVVDMTGVQREGRYIAKAAGEFL